MLTQVEPANFSRIQDILERNFKACNVESRTSLTYVMAQLTLHSTQGTVGVWVDNAKDPHALLVASIGKFGVLDETYCFINTIYVDEEHRTSALAKDMIDTITLFAKSKACDTIQGSSWVYRGAAGTDAIWKEFGFEPQETIYVKRL